MEFHSSRLQSILLQLEPEITATFEYLHANPEISFKEFNTTEFIKAFLTDLGIEIIDIDMETGVVGLLRGGGEGPCVALRADIDGLPVQELADCPYKSKVDGVMHACGHDTHAGALLGAARILSKMRAEINGSVKFLFQPAEERNQGAKLMIQHGALKNPDVDIIFGMHNSPEIPVGQVGVKAGGLMAAVDRFYITVHGKGGHGGVPHRTKDPVVATAAMINSLQHIVSRKINPEEMCVVSICSLHAGTGMTYNVIPEEVTMVGTTRSFGKEVGASLEGLIRNIAESVTAAHDCTAELEYIYDQPAVINPANLYPVACKSVESVKTSLGQALVCDPRPSTGGEDFTFFMQEIPAFFYFLGVGDPEREVNYPWHSPHFYADKRAIAVGAGVYAESVFNAIEAMAAGTL